MNVAFSVAVVAAAAVRISPLRDRDPRWFSCLSPLLLLIKLQHVAVVGGVVPAVSAVETDAVVNKDAGFKYIPRDKHM